ncbi:uncharacterized protein BYT42DRAFT_71319 [Radiomyces spectabilis]|uniref:uncharacterized protein n=1 Tax=Radiomyces spectabilis TaxID=64574 RepID=UPI00221F0DCD|nr:uncharacterized protein BYT42DRAFT_71319 [Radiomyces spectabilis]KAI8371512.1 hypothetical protein BYT42DRAFT_71319 [Radiomyces spectabilis]
MHLHYLNAVKEKKKSIGMHGLDGTISFSVDHGRVVVTCHLWQEFKQSIMRIFQGHYQNRFSVLYLDDKQLHHHFMREK